jgi:predicted nucleotide-binding protein
VRNLFSFRSASFSSRNLNLTDWVALMARNTTIVQLQSANLSQDKIKKAIPRIKKRISELNDLDVQKVNENNISEILEPIKASIDETLSTTYGYETVEYKRFIAAKEFYIPYNFYEQTPIFEIRAAIDTARRTSVGLLTQAIKSLEERLEDFDEESEKFVPNKIVNVSENRKIFIVHGHDNAPREAVARFLDRCGFISVILHEQANQGNTIIEKFEAHSDVGFAVVLLTPDDVGGPKSGPTSPRARQNVILELGYFIGRLGRSKVCAMKVGELELPSDIFGVVWTPFDGNEGWKASLARELQASGYPVDWNKVMK